MTVHAAKGLEFNNVVVVGVEEELFPSSMACDSLQAIEEERRLLYVAITRAKKFCMLSYASSRYRNGQTMVTRPSRFLRDIDPQYLKMIQGSDIDDSSRINPLDNYRESYHSSSSAGRLFNPSQRPAYPDHKTSATGGGWLKRREDSRQVEKAEPTGGGEAGEFILHDVSELYSGLKILHGRFGQGVIDDVDDNPAGAKIIVTFKGADRKTLLLRFARFKILK
jgi:DNA helicase-2/ATP-dependent DNA helicase PcrA